MTLQIRRRNGSILRSVHGNPHDEHGGIQRLDNSFEFLSWSNWCGARERMYKLKTVFGRQSRTTLVEAPRCDSASEESELHRAPVQVFG
ncbi:hypothetical protein BH10ACT11_BH10ACT11_16470 [soil metagenome]